MTFDWKGLVGSIAPTIATALGGPLAGTAVQAISNAVLGKSDATDQEINKALQGATPDQIASIKKADQEFAEKMKQMDIDLIAMQYKNIESARSKEAASKDYTPKILAAVAVLGFVGVIACVLLGFEPKEVMRDGFWMLVGAAIATYKDVYGYYFGSSSGSAEKNRTIEELKK